MTDALFTTLFHAALLLAGVVAFVAWGFAGFPVFVVVKAGRK